MDKEGCFEFFSQIQFKKEKNCRKFICREIIYNVLTIFFDILALVIKTILKIKKNVEEEKQEKQ